MDLKYVDFSFKVKSSAIKILKAKQGVNLKYIFEYLSSLNLKSSDHKRHYISEIEPMYISIPQSDTQDFAANLFSVIDEKINIEIEILKLLTEQKWYFLQQMFI
jgi:type I restriction enzyme S subunit